jgi:predicted enzyme related to lactoylglutathione lyase
MWYNIYNNKRFYMNYNIKLNSFYLCVQNLERAVNFYERLLNQKAEGNGTLFTINGIRFWLFDYKNASDNRVVFGHNCLPSFEVDNIEALLKRLEELHAQIVYPLTRLGNNLVLEFKDSEGNDIEIYSKCPLSKQGASEKYLFN